MNKAIFLASVTAVLLTAQIQAQEAKTVPVGFNKISLVGLSDTIISLPLTNQPVFTGKVASVSGSVLTLEATGVFTADQLGVDANYVMVESGAKEGTIYSITDNGTNTITVNLNGDDASAVATARISVMKYQTISELFPDADLNVSYLESNSEFDRTTEILVPNYSGSGTGLAASQTFYYLNGAWRLFGVDPSVSYDSTPMIPNGYAIVRNNSAFTGSFIVKGRVLPNKLVIPLATLNNGVQDNYVGILKPTGVDLNAAGLTLSAGDKVVLFDNTTPGFNKAGTEHTSLAGLTLNSGSGLIVRKATSTGATQFWVNTIPSNWSL